jgi:hypothetical protein
MRLSPRSMVGSIWLNHAVYGFDADVSSARRVRGLGADLELRESSLRRAEAPTHTEATVRRQHTGEAENLDSQPALLERAEVISAHE